MASAQTNGGSTPTRGFEPGTRAPPARRRWPRPTEASRRKTRSFGRFSRRFRAQTRLHSLIGQNRGKRFVTRASRVISVRSTGLAESCLTSQIGRDGVYSGSYERIMKVDNFPPYISDVERHVFVCLPFPAGGQETPLVVVTMAAVVATIAATALITAPDLHGGDETRPTPKNSGFVTCFLSRG